MRAELEQAYDTLELDAGATLAEARAAYLDLVKVWHPDRYMAGEERLRRKAEEKLKAINAAWEIVRLEAGDAAEPPLVALAPVRFGSLWGFVDALGDCILYPEFRDARPFSEGLAAVVLIERWGYIDTSGRFVIVPLFDACGDFSEGLAGAAQRGRWGYIDRGGRYVVMPRFDEVRPFRNGVADVRLGELWARVDRQGRFKVRPPEQLV